MVRPTRKVWNRCAHSGAGRFVTRGRDAKRQDSPVGRPAAVCRNQVVGWLAASMIFRNFSGTSDAPPIRPPSMSGCASRS